MKYVSTFVAVLTLASFAALQGCDNRRPSEKVGDGLEQSAEGVRDAVDGR